MKDEMRVLRQELATAQTAAKYAYYSIVKAVTGENLDSGARQYLRAALCDLEKFADKEAVKRANSEGLYER